IKRAIKKNKYHYPSIKFFVQKAIYNELSSYKSSSASEVDEFYSKLKDILEQNPDLKEKIDEIYSSEIKKLRRSVVR
ncbi:hypothetical protein HYW99_02535, partial [Candidatus Woesearchaeota archaeon]|nr:hypothetical protein [Candidatus Woesearchaeota archaeon]